MGSPPEPSTVPGGPRPKAHQALSPGGEFQVRGQEWEYRRARFPEHVRQTRLLFRYALCANLLFYLSDLHFLGSPHLRVAIGARSAIVLASLAGLAVLGRIGDSRRLQALCLAWSALVLGAGALLVTPHTEVALFVTIVLPAVFYLALPAIAFRWTLVSGLSSSLVLLGGYLLHQPLGPSVPGLLCGMLTLNLVLVLVLTRANRLRRLEWAATRAERSANRELSEHREMLRSLLQAIPTPMLIMAQDSHRIIQVNAATRRFFGAAALGPAAAPTLALEDYLAEPDLARLNHLLAGNGEVLELEFQMTFPEGKREVLVAANRVRVGQTRYLLAVLVDITRRKEMEADLKRLASTDPLTGLANRNGFFPAAALEIKRARRFGRPLTVLMIDLDLFKRINDTHGHEMGDLALSTFADLCRGSVREHDLVARLGGEEFALFLPETPQEDAFVLADRLRCQLARLRIGKQRMAVTISIGLAEVRPGELTIDAALARADRALYAAKRGGRNRVVRYDPAMDAPGEPG